MRKLLMGLILVIIIVLAGATYLLPSYISNQISGRIAKNLQTETVEAQVETTPNFMLLLGQIDDINIKTTNIKLDRVTLNELSLQGQNVEISVQDLLLARRLVVNSAEQLTITGIIDEVNLTHLLSEEADKFDDVVVKINPENIKATGKISFFGQEASVDVQGIIVLDGKNIMLRITDASTKNNLIGKIGISFTKDIFLFSADKLPLQNVKFTKVEQQNGQILIEADINK